VKDEKEKLQQKTECRRQHQVYLHWSWKHQLIMRDLIIIQRSI